jgi:O-6-methylguanine DNA methyltransferase
MNHLHLTTPVGTLLLTWNSRGAMSRVDWLPIAGPIPTEGTPEPHLPMASGASEMLAAMRGYFRTGQPLDEVLGVQRLAEEFLDASSWSEFERQVYLAVMRIPHGETRTYSWVAGKIGKRGATRAVGQALRRNRHLILVPCHRVVGVQDLGGFMGADDVSAPEVQFKQRLLAWEDSWRNPPFSFLTE